MKHNNKLLQLQATKNCRLHSLYTVQITFIQHISQYFANKQKINKHFWLNLGPHQVSKNYQ